VSRTTISYKGRTIAEGEGAGCAFVGLMIGFTSIAAWITHVIWVIRILAAPEGTTIGRIVLAVCGVFFPPVGVIHGGMIWFGAGFW